MRILNIFKKAGSLVIVGASLVGVQNASAAVGNAKTFTVYNDSDVLVNRKMTLGVGVYRLVTVDAIAINTLHGWLEVAPRMYVGFGFGADGDFTTATISGDFRYDMVRKGNASLFLNGQMGWFKVTKGLNGFAAGLLGGIGYNLTENVQASFAYGLQLYFADNFNDHVGITNNDYVGNFGLHWFF